MSGLLVGNDAGRRVVYAYDANVRLWQSTGLEVHEFCAAELGILTDALERKSGVPHGTWSERTRRELIKSMAESMPTENVGGLMGRVAYEGGMFMDLDDMKPRARTMADEMYQEMHANYLPDAKVKRIPSMLFGPRKNKKRADAERNFVATLAFENSAFLTGPGANKLLVLMHGICGHTEIIRRYDPRLAASVRADRMIEVCDFDETKLDKHTLFSWICQQSLQYGY